MTFFALPSLAEVPSVYEINDIDSTIIYYQTIECYTIQYQQNAVLIKAINARQRGKGKGQQRET